MIIKSLTNTKQSKQVNATNIYDSVCIILTIMSLSAGNIWNNRNPLELVFKDSQMFFSGSNQTPF